MRNWKNWIKAAGVRAIKTVAQTAVATIGTAVALGDVNWLMVASASVLAGILSLLTSVAGLPDDASTADIVAGETLTVEQLLYCLLVVSANEVSNILAEAVSGSVTAFVALMNQRAQELGCENTHFVNTSGLPDNEHYTTAWDIYLFTREAMKYDEFMTIVNTKAYDVPATNKSIQNSTMPQPILTPVSAGAQPVLTPVGSTPVSAGGRQ